METIQVQFSHDNQQQVDRWSRYAALMIGVLVVPALVFLASLKG